jgi:hypothetical protein
MNEQQINELLQNIEEIVVLLRQIAEDIDRRMK